MRVLHPVAPVTSPSVTIPDGSKKVRFGAWMWYRDRDGKLHEVVFADVILDRKNPGSLNEIVEGQDR